MYGVEAVHEKVIPAGQAPFNPYAHTLAITAARGPMNPGGLGFFLSGAMDGSPESRARTGSRASLHSRDRKQAFRILVVEDDQDTMGTMIDVLEGEGYTTAGAGDGRQALKFLAETTWKPDLILLDLTMPHMDGFQFREEQLKNARLSRIPVIVVTADVNAMTKAADIRAAGLLRKPISIEAMLGVVERIFKLRSRTDGGAPTFPLSS